LTFVRFLVRFVFSYPQFYDCKCLSCFFQKLFRCADHLKCFITLQSTKYWFVQGFADHMSQTGGPLRLWGNHWTWLKTRNEKYHFNDYFLFANWSENICLHNTDFFSLVRLLQKLSNNVSQFSICFFLYSLFLRDERHFLPSCFFAPFTS